MKRANKYSYATALLVCGFGGQASFAAIEGGSIRAIEGGSIKAIEGGSIKAIEGGSIKAIEGGSIKAIEGGSIKAIEGGSRKAIEGGSRKAIEGGSRKAIEGGSRKAIEGGSRKAIEGGSRKAIEGGSRKAIEGGSRKAIEGGSRKAIEGGSRKAIEGGSGKFFTENAIEVFGFQLLAAGPVTGLTDSGFSILNQEFVSAVPANVKAGDYINVFGGLNLDGSFYVSFVNAVDRTYVPGSSKIVFSGVISAIDENLGLAQIGDMKVDYTQMLHATVQFSAGDWTTFEGVESGLPGLMLAQDAQN